MVKKRKARKPIARKITYLKYGFVITEHENHYCPRCNHVLNAGPNYQPKYCNQCGQKGNQQRVMERCHDVSAGKHIGIPVQGKSPPLGTGLGSVKGQNYHGDNRRI